MVVQQFIKPLDYEVCYIAFFTITTTWLQKKW